MAGMITKKILQHHKVQKAENNLSIKTTQLIAMARITVIHIQPNQKE